MGGPDLAPFASVDTGTVTAPDGVRLSVADRPGARRPILLLHGLLQSHLAFRPLFAAPALADFRLVAPDLRGHGRSDKPEAPDAYREPARWAGDVAAILDACGLARPLVVAWSYGGRVLGDYLDTFGGAALGGCVFVAATLRTLPEHFAPDLGAVFSAVCSDDWREATDALRAFAAAVVPEPFGREREEGLVAAASVPLPVRRALMGRPADYEASLARLACPVLVLHGARDAVVRPAQSQWTARITGAPLDLWDDAGHAPFAEHPGRFAARLAAFATELDRRPTSASTDA
jgi:pimeloyl-ACP methyl ester carboxylesterase